MVVAKLQVICGNCGSNDDFEYKHDEYSADAEETTMRYETFIKCRNCSTIHWLNDSASNVNSIRPLK